MIRERYAHLFELCHPLLWPWLWLQLWLIVSFTRRTGRKVLFEVCENGCVEVLFIADDPAFASRMAGEANNLAQHVPVWFDPALASNLPACLSEMAIAGPCGRATLAALVTSGRRRAATNVVRMRVRHAPPRAGPRRLSLSGAAACQWRQSR